LRLPNLPPELERVVRPLLAEAERSSGESGSAAPAPAPAGSRDAPRPAALATVSGTLTGGGLVGPGAAVVWLKRLDGPTPAPRPGARSITQKNKTFLPRVLVVPLGSTVEFRNDDLYYHNVFSLSGTQQFDTGVYAAGLSYKQVFRKPGLVELLCNIHSSMRGYIYVVDSAYYAQPRSSGAFTIRGVPPGRYQLFTWHETSAELIRQPVQVSPAGTHGLTVALPHDRPPPVATPDKYGRPRQPQLGY
jgi:plastocyanin